MVYVVDVKFTLGVPEITPLDRVIPLGKAGCTAQVATFPPVFDMVIVAIAVPLVSVISDSAPKLATGSLIVNWKVALLDPPELFA